MADAVAKTSTPDAAAGNPIDVTTVTTGAGVVDRQIVGIGDPAANNKVAVNASGEASIIDTRITDGTQKAIARGGAKGATTAADLTGTAEGADHQALDVQLYHGGASKDPTAIRALTVADAVNVGQWVGSAAPTVGSKTSANSVPVVVASDQVAIPISTIAGAITPGTAATSLGKAEDAASASGDTGVSVLAVRLDVPNLPTAAQTNANNDYTAAVADDHGVLWVRKRQLPTYTASYRLADATGGALQLSFAFTANTNKQIATIYHAAGSTKTVKLRRVSVFCTTMAAAVVGFELRALSAATAPATGNPAITPRQHDPADGAAEATCLALPTTAGSLVGADTGVVSPHTSLNAGVTTASVSPATFGTAEIVLYEYKDGSEMKPLTMRAATAEGYAVNARSSATVTQTFTVSILFTEE